jgi:hypothetical protein
MNKNQKGNATENEVMKLLQAKGYNHEQLYSL